MKTIIALTFFLFTLSPIFSFGTYSEGWTLGRVIQFQSQGLVFESYEGIMEVTNYNETEKCDETKEECFTPIKTKIEFSVRPENSELVNFINKNLNQEILFQYKVHRIEAMALSTEFEILTAVKQSMTATDLPEKKIVQKTGSKRNFSVQGRILNLNYQGTTIGTYEGLYIDEVRGKVHPFSITNETMAELSFKTLKSGVKHYFGISVAYATGLRKSNYDLFEINLKNPAGGVYPEEKK